MTHTKQNVEIVHRERNAELYGYLQHNVGDGNLVLMPGSGCLHSVGQMISSFLEHQET